MRHGARSASNRWRASAALNIVLPAAILALTYGLAGPKTPIAVNIALSLLIVAAIGLFLYRIAFQPLAHTSVLVLLIASVGCHLALQGLGLVFFGAEGLRGPALSSAAVHHRTAAFHRPEPRGLWPDHRLHHRAVAVLRLHADGQGAARHRRQPPRRPPRRHPHHAVGTDRLPARLRDRRDFGNPDRADHHALLRHRLPDRPEGLHRRHHRRARELSAHRGRGPGGRHASKPSPRSMPAISRRSSSSR